MQRSGVAGGEATAAARNVAALEAAGDIAALVELLRCGDAAGMAAAARALQRLACYSNASRVAIAEAGAVVPLVELLRCGDMEGKKAAGGALCNLALNNNANKVSIMEAGAVAPLVELLRVPGNRQPGVDRSPLVAGVHPLPHHDGDREGWGGGAAGGAAAVR